MRSTVLRDHLDAWLPDHRRAAEIFDNVRESYDLGREAADARRLSGRP